jgi:hypothetical protein
MSSDPGPGHPPESADPGPDETVLPAKPFDVIGYLNRFRPAIRTEPEPDLFEGSVGSKLPPARGSRRRVRRGRLSG